MSIALQALMTAVYGVGSAFIPVLNAEAYALATASRTRPVLAVVLLVVLAAGQTVGKLVLFEAARRGSARYADRLTGERAARWAGRIQSALATRRTGLPLVLTSAVLGLPPLAAVSLAAGAAGQRRREFATLCLFGRIVRFAALALPVAWAFG